VDEATRAHCLSKLGFRYVREGRDDVGFGYLNEAFSLRNKIFTQSAKDKDKVMLAAFFLIFLFFIDSATSLTMLTINYTANKVRIRLINKP